MGKVRSSIDVTNPDDPTAASARPILFYDGECGLCARSVQWCLRHDRHARLAFAPLQGRTYAERGGPVRPLDTSTLVLLDQEGLHVRGDAVLRVLRIVGGFHGVLGAVGRAVPRFARDALYRFVARRRYAWFGSADSCRLPSASTDGRFLP